MPRRARAAGQAQVARRLAQAQVAGGVAGFDDAAPLTAPLAIIAKRRAVRRARASIGVSDQ